MSVEFNADEAFELAQQVEKRAMEFYLQAAESCEQKSLADIYLELSAMEAQHEMVFAAMKDMPLMFIAPPVKQEVAGQYWPVLAGSMIADVSIELPRMFQNKRTPQDILKTAMAFERDTVVFLVGIKEMLADAKERSRIDQIIIEEMGHLISLGSQLAKL